MARLRYAIGAVSLACMAMVTSGCGQSLPEKPPSYDELPAGRYAIVPVAGTREVIQLDTGSGKTWRLAWSEDADGAQLPTGWVSLDAPSSAPVVQ